MKKEIKKGESYRIGFMSGRKELLDELVKKVEELETRNELGKKAREYIKKETVLSIINSFRE